MSGYPAVWVQVEFTRSGPQTCPGFVEQADGDVVYVQLVHMEFAADCAPAARLISCACVTHDSDRLTPAWSPVTLGEVSVQGGTVLTVTGPWSSEDSATLRRSGSTVLWLNYAHGFSEPTLRLIEDLPATITRLHITARWITDLSPIAVLGDRLEALSVTTAREASLDLTQLPVLTELAADWAQVRATIGAAVRLVDVYLGHYREADLSKFAPLELLGRLTLKDWPSIASLTGVEHLTSLKHLTVVLARNLSDLTALDSTVGRQLETLDLESCRRIDDLGAIGRCTALTTLNLGDIGDVASAAPLAALQHLHHLFLYESTRFQDGDLAPLLELRHLKELRLMNRRQYKPSLADIESQLGLVAR